MRHGDRAFATGDLVASRYRIVRFIAEGGMGEVYQAFDEELQDLIALKTIRGVADEATMERFRREVLLARKVTHANVSRVFDLGRHDDDTRSVTFLTMELLDGESLSHLISRQAPLSEETAWPLVVGMADGLAAAHQAGVLHRDFKPGNVLLVQRDGGTHVVVTDFGQARGLGGSHSMTETGLVMGTPAYMAPEQVEGASLTPAADVYALGLVLYEMTTGHLPFQGNSALSTALKRLRETPPTPRTFAPDLSPRWETVILRCLERDPARRFASPLDVVRALRGGVSADPPVPRRRRALFAAATTIAVVALGITATRVRTRPTSVAPVPAGGRRSVAVLALKNLTGRPDAAWLSTALSEMLTTELAAGEVLRMIPGENVARMKIDLALADVDALAPDTLARIRDNLGTDVVVLGSFVALGPAASDQVRLDLRIQDTRAGNTLAAVHEEGTESQLIDLVSRVGARLRTELGVSHPSRAQAEGARASQPRTAEATRLYAEGLDALRRFDALAARASLQSAAAADPRHAPTRAALSEAWATLGYETRARQEARGAFELAAFLPREEKLLVEGRHLEALRDWDRAIETYRTLWGFFADNLEHGLRLAAAQSGAGRGRDALATVEALRRMPSTARDDARIDLAEALAAQSLAEAKRQQAAAARAAEKGRRAGARLMVARARLLQGQAFIRLGNLGAAREALLEARRIDEDAGDRAGAAWAMYHLASVASMQGHMDEQSALRARALALFREIGHQTGIGWSLGDQANRRFQSGDLAGAAESYAGALSLFREIGDRRSSAWMLSRLADVHEATGQLDSARASYAQAMALFAEVQDERSRANQLGRLARLAAETGDVAGARRSYEDALKVFRALDHRLEIASTGLSLAQARLWAGEVGAARREAENALAEWERLGHARGVAGARLVLSAIALEEGRAGDAAALARQVLEQLSHQQAAASEIPARCYLAQALLSAGDREGARQALGPIDLGRMQVLADRLWVRSLRARVDGAGGAPAHAASQLVAVADEARRAGLLRLELETALALADAEDAAGHAQTARARRDSVRVRATASGLLLLARKSN